MIIKGKYNSTNVYADYIEESAYAQILNLMNQEFVKDSRIAIMPDVHAGTGCTIGTTMTLHGKVVPNLVGVDIGCGMLVAKLAESVKEIDFQKLDSVIRENVPSGCARRQKKHSMANGIEFLKGIIADVDKEAPLLSIGTLGGGNHFIEIDEDSYGHKYLVIHSGSRHLGIDVAKYWQNVAIKNKNSNNEIYKEIAKLKANGQQHKIQEFVKSLKENVKSVPDELAYLQGDAFNHYINDMKITQKYATVNRMAIMDSILKGMGWKIANYFQTIHNYIDTDSMVLRKGAISLKKGEAAIIPISMAYGSLIVEGKGNEQWNCSGPHGAGRIMSRSKAKECLDMEEFKEKMSGVFTTCVSMDTIDESPMAYKDHKSIMRNIGETAEIMHVIKPLYNFKDGGK